MNETAVFFFVFFFFTIKTETPKFGAIRKASDRLDVLASCKSEKLAVIRIEGSIPVALKSVNLRKLLNDERSVTSVSTRF